MVAGGAKPKMGYFPLLIDTGADVSCISPQLTAQLGLRSIGKRSVSVPTGTATANTHLVDIAIPFGDPTKGADTMVLDNITVMEYLGNHPQYQGLLGRDIINRGLFSIAGYDNRFTICM